MAEKRRTRHGWVVAAAAALAICGWAVAVVVVRRFVRAIEDVYRQEGGRGVASAVEPTGARVAECETKWRDWERRRDAVPMRDVTFGVVADEEFRSRIGPGWKDDVRRRMARASAVFEREFRVRFVVRSAGDWTSDDGAASIHDLHSSLARSTAGVDVDVVIAFMDQAAPGHSPRQADEYDRGVSYYYGRCCIVRTGMPLATSAWPYEDETVLHEIGHLFGAWHSTDGRSVMRAVKRGPQVLAFDVCARTAILASRIVDFARGTDCLDDAAIDSLHGLWSSWHAADAEFPPSQALCTEAWWKRAAGDDRDASRRFDRALALERRFGPLVRTPGFADLAAWSQARRPR